MNGTFNRKRNFADMMKLRILRWADYPELSQWAIVQSEYTYKRETEGDLTQKRRCHGKDPKEAESGREDVHRWF